MTWTTANPELQHCDTTPCPLPSTSPWAGKHGNMLTGGTNMAAGCRGPSGAENAGLTPEPHLLL